MSEEKKEIDSLVEKLEKIIEKVTGVEVDKNTDKIIDATHEFSEAVEEFTKKLDNIDNKFKTIIECGVIIDISWGGESKIRVIGGKQKQITKVLDEIRKQVEK